MNVLVIVRDPDLRGQVVSLVEARNCAPSVFSDPEHALASIEKDSFHCALVEATADGDFAAITRLRKIEHADLLVLALTDADGVTRALDAGATDFIRVGAPEDVLDARMEVMARHIQRRRKTHWHGVPFLDLVEKAGDVIEVLTPDFTILYTNPAVEPVLGYPREEVIGRYPNELYGSGVHPPEFFQEINEVIERGETWTGTVVSRCKDGDLVHLECNFAAVFDDQGRLTHRIAVKRDVTDRAAREKALEAANVALAEARDAALDASQEKSAFLANMSHELRTPLNAIIGYSEMLLEEAQEEGQEDAATDLARIHNAGTHLLSLINDVLDISKIEAGKMTLHLEDFDIRSLVEDIVHTMQPQIVKAGNRFELACDDDIGTMHADVTKVRQTLLNLLSNANKFTERGLIRLSVHRDGFWVTFKVRDTGIGISAEALGRLFTPFVQADASTTRKFGGTGLGLAISQRFCQMMAGEIQVKSKEGEGSTFYVRLPKRVPDRSSSLRLQAVKEAADSTAGS